jgi:hypothetical protein
MAAAKGIKTPWVVFELILSHASETLCSNQPPASLSAARGYGHPQSECFILF